MQKFCTGYDCFQEQLLLKSEIKKLFLGKNCALKDYYCMPPAWHLLLHLWKYRYEIETFSYQRVYFKLFLCIACHYKSHHVRHLLIWCILSHLTLSHQLTVMKKCDEENLIWDFLSLPDKNLKNWSNSIRARALGFIAVSVYLYFSCG